jgi:purine-nucleoside phosphorylase
VSFHIGAEPGDIADIVLLPGDPLRARWIATTFLQDATCYSEVRGMFGYTGTYRGRPVSVQGTGMGQPSLAIYVHELLDDYGATTLVRVGSCGGLRPEVAVRDVVVALTASTDSAMNRVRFGGLDYAPAADFALTRAVVDQLAVASAPHHVGSVFSTDAFYFPRPELRDRLVEHGVLAVEMETSALYTAAAARGARALSVCTVSDNLVTGEEMPAAEREQTFTAMVEATLEAVATLD